jgi:acyl-CoA synthetase (AMP-forming)/AMP-acid ligase II
MLREGLLHGNAGRVVFVEDGGPRTVAHLTEAADALADRLSSSGARRAAVLSRRPVVLAQCLLGCARAGTDLLMLRSSQQADAAFFASAGVDFRIAENDLSVTPTGAPNGASRSRRDAGEPPSVLVPTSGTSGTPKIARHTMASMLGRIRAPRAARRPVRWLLTYQPAGFAGLQMILTALATESSVVCLRDINVPELAKAALEHEVTHVSGTPTFWRSFVLCLGARAATLDLAQITLGGELVDQATLDRLARAFPRARVCHIYASTEAGALFSVTDGRAGFPAKWLAEGVDGVGLRIRDGVLEVKSPRAMAGYLDPTKRPYADDGWLVTGDRVDVRGDRAFFVGRQDAVINIGGGKVTPDEVESALIDVPGVQDLRAYAAKNPITGFVVALEVAVSSGADPEQVKKDVLDAARARLAAYKVPRLVKVVETIRSDASGKKSRASA